MNFLKRFFDTVKDMPSTNVQSFTAICLAILYVLGSMLGSFLIGITASFRTVPINILPPQAVHENIGQFILLMMGIATGQYIGKRATWGELYKKQPEGSAPPVPPSEPAG